jgi:hypothetical protein
MSEQIPFFPDEQAYTSWIQSLPPIMSIQQGGEEELAENVEGPYYYDPHCLILRVGRSYCALVRVPGRRKARLSWYVAETRETGEEVFATYLVDRSQVPPEVVGGPTIQRAREAIAEFRMSGRSRLATVHLWPLRQEPT